MRYVFARDLQPGMILAQELLDPSGRVLAEVNSSLSEFAINRIIKDGYDGVYIQDDLSSDVHIESVIRAALWAKAMDCVRLRNISECREAVDEIIESLKGKRDVSLDLNDFRTNENYLFALVCNYFI